jgi:hypothetical protein
MQKEIQTSIVGKFFLSRDNSTLYHIAGNLNGSVYYAVQAYKGVLLESESVWPLGQLTHMKLYPSAELAYAASQKAAK